MEEVQPFTFEHVDTQLECFSSRDAREQLLQWNLDAALRVERFKFSGAFAAGDYERILRDFFRDAAAMSRIEVSGTPAGVPLVVESQTLSTNVMTMDFFDRLEECDVVSSMAGGGQIRGCFEEYFDGIQSGDKLREMLLNSDSENAYVFKESERLELIYVLFRLIVLGGSMCQPDDKIDRYLAMTKALYRDALTVYKDANTGSIAVSGRVYQIKNVPGLALFSHPDKDIVNLLLVVVDPLKKHLLVLKNDFKPFW